MANIKSFRRLSSMLPSRSKSLSGPASGPKGPVLIEGLLEKKKTFGSSKFFCSLHDGKLWYSEDKEKTFRLQFWQKKCSIAVPVKAHHKGRESLIDISHAQSVREGKAKFSFEIITSSRTHTFVADSQSTRDKWIASLREVMRVTSRKNSTLSYIESANSDEETGAAAFNPRSSVASQRVSEIKTSNNPTSPSLKPGFGASLPMGVTLQTPSTLKDGTTHPSRTSEMKSLIESTPGTTDSPKTKPCVQPVMHEGVGNRVMSTVKAAAAVSDGARNEIKEEEWSKRATLSRDGEEAGKSSVSSSSSISEQHHQPGASSEAAESGADNRVLTGGHSDGNSAGNDDSPVTIELVSTSPNSLYANNDDIKKFIKKKCLEEEDQASDCVISEETQSEMKRKKDSTTSEEPESPKDSARNRGDTDEDEERDDVFTPERSEKTEEVKRPAMPVLRRPSHPVIPVVVEPEQTEPESVELDVDFCHESIPNLPHPRLEDNWSSAFVEMRAILSMNPVAQKETFIFKGEHGCAVDSLKHFLKNIECG